MKTHQPIRFLSYTTSWSVSQAVSIIRNTVTMGHPPAVLLVVTVTSVILLCCSVWAQQELCQAFIKDFTVDEFVLSGKRMILFSREKNWADAKAHCESIGMRLLTTSTKKEADDLKEYLNKRVWDGRVPQFIHWYFWLGANNLDPDGVWRWQTTKQDMTYTAWGEGEPSGGDEHCLELRMTSYELTIWNDIWCNVRKRYICEVEDTGLN